MHLGELYAVQVSHPPKNTWWLLFWSLTNIKTGHYLMPSAMMLSFTPIVDTEPDVCPPPLLTSVWQGTLQEMSSIYLPPRIYKKHHSSPTLSTQNTQCVWPIVSLYIKTWVSIAESAERHSPCMWKRLFMGAHWLSHCHNITKTKSLNKYGGK